MGLLDRFRRVGKKKGVYHLLYQPTGEKAGWRPVDKFDYPITKEEAFMIMVKPGSYMLQRRVGGRIAGYEWDEPYIVSGVEAETIEVKGKGGATESDKIAQAIETDMVRAVRWFKLPDLIQQAMRKAFGGENPFPGGDGGGGQGVTAGTVKDAIKGLREEYEDLHGIFGSSTDTQTKRIPVKGEIPAWLVYLPEITDQMGENIEKRLEKWGFLGSPTGGRKLLTMPDKPVKKRKLDLAKLKRKSEEKPRKEEKKSGGKAGK